MSAQYGLRGSGTDSLKSNQKSVEHRSRRLLQEIDQYRTNNPHIIEREEAQVILNQRLRQSGKMFDDELIDAIFNLFDKDATGRISKQEFWQGYVDVENFFTETINTCNFKILELK